MEEDERPDDGEGSRNASAADQSMEFQGGNNTFFSEQRIIDFNVSHNFDVSKVEEDESVELKKVLVQLRQ